MPFDERVLVIPEIHFRRAGYFEGFRDACAEYTQQLFDPATYSFLPRSQAETDPTFKQLIPYVILTCQDRVFHYRRGAKGSETRLQTLRSIGIGGHISETDAAGEGDPYSIGLQRELDEEVQFGPTVRRELFGFIYDPRTPVGSVHLGIVHHFELEAAEAVATDVALTDAGFESIKKLRNALPEFETWSQFVLERLAS